MGRKRNKQVTPVKPEVTELTNITPIEEPQLEPYKLTEADFKDYPEFAENGMEVGDTIFYDKEESIDATVEGTLPNALKEFPTLLNLFLRSDMNKLNTSTWIPMDYLEDVDGDTFMSINIAPYDFNTHMKGRVSYCTFENEDIKKADFMNIKNEKVSYFCMPTSYDIIKDSSGLFIAHFSKEGKLDFKNLFNIELQTLKSGL